MFTAHICHLYTIVYCCCVSIPLFCLYFINNYMFACCHMILQLAKSCINIYVLTQDVVRSVIKLFAL